MKTLVQSITTPKYAIALQEYNAQYFVEFRLGNGQLKTQGPIVDLKTALEITNRIQLGLDELTKGN